MPSMFSIHSLYSIWIEYTLWRSHMTPGGWTCGFQLCPVKFQLKYVEVPENWTHPLQLTEDVSMVFKGSHLLGGWKPAELLYTPSAPTLKDC